MKYLLATVALSIVATIGVANAQFTTNQQPDDEPNLQCEITSAWSLDKSPDRDPVRDINVWISRAEGDGHLTAMDVVYTLRSGIKHYRSRQYDNATLTEKGRYSVQWSGVHAGIYHMTGSLYYSMTHKRWFYNEVQHKRNLTTMSMASSCHDVVAD
jgi:hypothetical protein